MVAVRNWHMWLFVYFWARQISRLVTDRPTDWQTDPFSQTDWPTDWQTHVSRCCFDIICSELFSQFDLFLLMINWRTAAEMTSLTSLTSISVTHSAIVLRSTFFLSYLCLITKQTHGTTMHLFVKCIARLHWSADGDCTVHCWWPEF